LHLTAGVLEFVRKRQVFGPRQRAYAVSSLPCGGGPGRISHPVNRSSWLAASAKMIILLLHGAFSNPHALLSDGYFPAAASTSPPVLKMFSSVGCDPGRERVFSQR